MDNSPLECLATDATQKFIWLSQMTGQRCIFSLSGGEKHDAPEGRKLISQLKVNEPCCLLMDRAYEDEQTRLMAIQHGFIPVVPPKKNRLQP